MITVGGSVSASWWPLEPLTRWPHKGVCARTRAHMLWEAEGSLETRPVLNQPHEKKDKKISAVCSCSLKAV